MKEEEKKVEITEEMRAKADRYASLSGKRFPEEDYAEYKERMRFTKKTIKNHLKGQRV